MSVILLAVYLPCVCAFGTSKPLINVVWFKCTDLRTHDHAALKAAHSDKLPVLHLYVFDPFWYEGKTRLCGFPKTGVLRTRFQLEAVEDLANRLEARGHRLNVRTNVSTAECFRELCKDYSINAVFAFHEVCSEELRIQREVQHVLHQNGPSPLRLYWGYELLHPEDLPFDTTDRGAFKEIEIFLGRVKGVAPRPSAQQQPDFVAGPEKAIHWWRASKDIPLADEVMGSNYLVAEDLGKESRWQGGETAALARVQEYLWDHDRLALDYVGATSATGYCKHIGRLCTGWFLISDLGIDWRMGGEWYESILVDYEPALNWFNWVYGCLEPINPHKAQARGQQQCREILEAGIVHDPDAAYIKRWIPELSQLPPLLAREPWRLNPEGIRWASKSTSLRKMPFLRGFQAPPVVEQGGKRPEGSVDHSGDTSFPGLQLWRKLVSFLLPKLSGLFPARLLPRAGASLRSFRYGVDYPEPVIQPISLMDAERAEAQVRAARAISKQQRDEASPSDLELLRVPVEVESPVSPPALRSRQIEVQDTLIIRDDLEQQKSAVQKQGWASAQNTSAPPTAASAPEDKDGAGRPQCGVQEFRV
ncbi:CRYD [Symbiodinium necroappetens]|uniref:CRYD protein n=1 Tax=Symbiodinium necroappetens TaxID=1628268 RepID=A0A812LV95_9DINO|nr:CRYD [Symbiodinium necroappetens]